jgi:hypothetical protein
MNKATTGFYRNASVTRLGAKTELLVVPGAKIHVTETETGVNAKIYSDPQLTRLIPGSTLTADSGGNYDYYLNLNYMVTENISSPTSGRVIIPNIGINTK